MKALSDCCACDFVAIKKIRFKSKITVKVQSCIVNLCLTFKVVICSENEKIIPVLFACFSAGSLMVQILGSFLDLSTEDSYQMDS
jgi:hypothetical protein